MKLANKLLFLLESEDGLEGGITTRKLGKAIIFTFNNKDGKEVGIVRAFPVQNGKILLIDQVSKKDNSVEDFMTKAYKMLLKQYEAIVSDRVLTDSAKKVWEKIQNSHEFPNKVFKAKDLNGDEHYVLTKEPNTKFDIDFQLP